MALFAVRLDRVERPEAHTAQDVLSHGDRLEVRRLDAGAVATEMVERQSGRDRSDQALIEVPMGEHRPAIHTSLCVTVPANVPLPDPAVAGPIHEPHETRQPVAANPKLSVLRASSDGHTRLPQPIDDR